MRPYGCAFLYMGYEEYEGFKIFSSDPSGNYSSWKALSMGMKEEALNNYLSENYRDNMTRQESIELIVNAIS